MRRQIIERVENADDRREFRLRLTRKGKTLYEELIPRLLRKEQEILACLSAQERKELAFLLGGGHEFVHACLSGRDCDERQDDQRGKREDACPHALLRHTIPPLK